MRAAIPADHDDEVEEARWIGLSEAEATLTHVGEREMVKRARAHLEAGGKTGSLP